MFALSGLQWLEGFVVAVALAAPAHAETKLEGSVVSTAPEQLVLAVEMGQYTLVVNPNTAITLDGKEAALESIAPGYTAKVTADKQGHQWIAKTIAAFTLK